MYIYTVIFSAIGCGIRRFPGRVALTLRHGGRETTYTQENSMIHPKLPSPDKNILFCVLLLEMSGSREPRAIIIII